MPCSTVSSDDVRLGLVPAVHSHYDVWERFAPSDETWGRWPLVWYRVAGHPDQGKSNHRIQIPDDAMTLERVGLTLTLGVVEPGSEQASESERRVRPR